MEKKKGGRERRREERKKENISAHQMPPSKRSHNSGITIDLSAISQNHGVKEWFGLEGTSQILQSQPPAMSRDPFHQPRLLPAPSNLALNPAREGAATASLGSLGQGITAFTVKNFFLLSSLNLPSFTLKPLCLVLSLHDLVKGL